MKKIIFTLIFLFSTAIAQADVISWANIQLSFGGNPSEAGYGIISDIDDTMTPAITVSFLGIGDGSHMETGWITSNDPSWYFDPIDFYGLTNNIFYTSIGKLEIFLDSSNEQIGGAHGVGVDFRISPIGTVPEPATGLMLLLGLGLIGWRRKKKL